MNNIAIEQRNALLDENISHLMTELHSGKFWMDQDAMLFVKQWLRQEHHKPNDNMVRKKL